MQWVSTREMALLAFLFFLPQALAVEEQPLQGVWKLVAVQSQNNNKEFGSNSPTWEFKGNKIVYGGEEVATFVLDLQTSPMAIDISFSFPKGACEGICKKEKDRLTLCINRSLEGIRERPSRFSVEGNSELRILEFTRDKNGQAGGTEGLNGFVGLMLQVDKDTGRIVVMDTQEGSPARKAGLKKGDILIQVGATKANEITLVVGAIRRLKPGQIIPMRIERDGKIMEVQVRVGVLPVQLLF